MVDEVAVEDVDPSYVWRLSGFREAGSGRGSGLDISRSDTSLCDNVSLILVARPRGLFQTIEEQGANSVG